MTPSWTFGCSVRDWTVVSLWYLERNVQSAQIYGYILLSMIQDLSSLERDKLALPNGEARQALHFFWPLNYWRCPNDGYRAGCKNVWTTVLLFRTTFALTIMLNCWISAGLLIKRPRVQLLAEPTTRVLNELKRERYLCNDIRKRSDFVVFWHKDDKTYIPVRSYS